MLASSLKDALTTTRHEMNFLGFEFCGKNCKQLQQENCRQQYADSLPRIKVTFTNILAEVLWANGRCNIDKSRETV